MLGRKLSQIGQTRSDELRNLFVSILFPIAYEKIITWRMSGVTSFINPLFSQSGQKSAQMVNISLQVLLYVLFAFK